MLVQYLKNLKKKLQIQELSVMVGAGFSKNVNNDLFPSWWQLLADMVKYMSEKSFLEEYNKLPTRLKIPYNKFLENKIDQYINLVGPLKVASNYMQLIGYRESLDFYIEMHTPFIETIADRKFLSYYESEILKRIPLFNDDLITHSKLVNLPFNNIYTTNYDNLLEECVNQNIEREIRDQIVDVKGSLQDLARTKNEAEVKRDAHEKELEKAQFVLEGIKNSITTGVLPSSTSFQAEEKNVTEIGIEINKNNYIITNYTNQIKSNERKLDELENQLKECPTIVVHSSQLALKKTRNIIKLHGSIRKPGITEYGFDNDYRKHYVITKEDFESYPTRHEAFTQLMRISLLQESFCLIGFSGVDPNFLSWIDWVRDVIFKSKDDHGEMPEKIYLISLSEEPAEKNKVAFYENHRIVFIPLMNAECVEFLERETSKKLVDKKSKKEALNLFFDFLQLDSNNAGPELAVELSLRTRFENISAKLPGLRINEELVDVFDLINDLEILIDLAPYNRIPSVNFIYDHNRYHFLRSASTYLRAIRNDKEAKKKILKILAQLIKVQFYPHSILFHEAQTTFDELLKQSKSISKEIYASFLLIDLYDSIWIGNNSKINKLTNELKKYKYEFVFQETEFLIALHECMSLRFDRLKFLLENWNATKHWKTMRAGLLSLVSIPDAIKEITENRQELLQEHVYELELYTNVKKGIYLSYDSFRNELRFLKQKGLSLIEDNLEYLTAETNKKEEKIKPYGEGKFNIGRTMSLSNTNVYLQSMQLVGILMYTGIPSTYLPLEKTYSALCNTLRVYPLPVVFYILQYSDENLLKRLGQDITYIDEVSTSLVTICEAITRAYFEPTTPDGIKKNITIFFAQLLIAIDPDVWESFFFNFWKDKLYKNTVFINRGYDRTKIIENALRYVKSSQVICKIILDCLEQFKEPNSEECNSAIQFLYDLAHNPFLKINATEIKKRIGRGLNKIIDQLGANPSLIFALGNLNVLLSDDDKKKIKRVLKNVDYSQINNARIWSVIIYYSKGDQKLLQIIKDALIVNALLWNAGFTDKGLTSHSEYIFLHKLRMDNDGAGIKWSKDESVMIYKKMLEELKKITTWLNRRSDPGQFAFILEEMLQFLIDEQGQLVNLSSYADTLESVKSVYRDQREFSKTLEGLISKDHSKVVWAISEFARPFYEYKNFNEYEFVLITALNKILLQSIPGLEACLQVVSQIFYDFRNEEFFKKFSVHLLEILQRYRSSLPENIDIPFVQEQLVRMAFVLNFWGNDSPVVIEFIDKLNQSRFNNIKYKLKHVLSNK